MILLSVPGAKSAFTRNDAYWKTHVSVNNLIIPAAKGVAKPKGPFTHAIFDAISDAISRTKRSLPYPARMLFSRSIAWIGKKVITYFL